MTFYVGESPGQGAELAASAQGSLRRCDARLAVFRMRLSLDRLLLTGRTLVEGGFRVGSGRTLGLMPIWSNG
jgi:hypothetical protein